MTVPSYAKPTGQGTFLTQNSEPDTITRNSGIFWAIFMFSSFVGDLNAYYFFQGAELIGTRLEH